MSTTVPLESRTQHKARWRMLVTGIVQGVGFRPFVYQLAQKLSLTGWIENTPQGTTIEIEGLPENLEHFQSRLHSQAPRTATLHEILISKILTQDDENFSIRTSPQQGVRRSVIPPDFATCPECLAEVNNPHSRRYRYPFTTCTQCGPRYSIVEAIPYDRINTTMKKFPLCGNCQREYEAMNNRRFHAEAMACSVCGPHVTLWDHKGRVIAEEETALTRACAVVQNGEILAVKGLGGFQLWADAQSDKAVQRLRGRKHRPRKPFGVLFPSLAAVKTHCHVSREEETLLTSLEAPIVLLRRKDTSSLASTVAPGNPYVGALLPFTPLHHLLMGELQTPVIATSGNRSEEPIVIDEYEALGRLNGIADAFLIHDRPIARPVDDSVVRLVNGNLMMLRRARGYAPTPILIKSSKRKERPSILAVGGHLKNTVAVTTQDQVIMSQHIGDLSTPDAYTRFEKTVSDHLRLFDIQPQAIACDLHPDFRSTIFAQKLGKAMNIPVVPVQHHHAHILSCMAEHGLEGPVLGVAWDGAGYGPDGTIWGGEFLLADDSGFRRVGHLKPFRLPGGEICMQEPRRVALSLLYETFGEDCLNMDLPPIRSLGRDVAQYLVEILKKNVNCPITTSMGRLFDGISSILGLCHINTFEAEAALALEFAAELGLIHGETPYFTSSLLSVHSNYGEHTKQKTPDKLPFTAIWQNLVKALVLDHLESIPPAQSSLKFHLALTDFIRTISQALGHRQIIFSGGVFQNTQLLRLIQATLSETDFTCHVHTPSHDGSLSIGQSLYALSHLKRFKNVSRDSWTNSKY